MKFLLIMNFCITSSGARCIKTCIALQSLLYCADYSVEMPVNCLAPCSYEGSGLAFCCGAPMQESNGGQ